MRWRSVRCAAVCGNVIADMGRRMRGTRARRKYSTARGNRLIGSRLQAVAMMRTVTVQLSSSLTCGFAVPTDAALCDAVVGHLRLEGCFPYYLPFGRSSDKTKAPPGSSPFDIKLSRDRDIPIDGWVESARGAQYDGWLNHEHSDFSLPPGCHRSICASICRDDGGALRDGAALEAAG
jgi:hypothetical protein